MTKIRTRHHSRLWLIFVYQIGDPGWFKIQGAQWGRLWRSDVRFAFASSFETVVIFLYIKLVIPDDSAFSIITQIR